MRRRLASINSKVVRVSCTCGQRETCIPFLCPESRCCSSEGLCTSLLLPQSSCSTARFFSLALIPERAAVLQLSLCRLTTALRHLHRSFVARRRHVNTRIRREEVRRPQMHLMDLTRHNGPILNARVVSQTKDTPHHHICISGLVAAGYCISNAIHFFARLHGKPSSSVEFVVSVFGDPEVVLGELGALGLNAVWICKQQLCSRRYQLVPYAISRDGVFDVFVYDFEDAVQTGFGILPCSFLDGCFADFVVVASRIGGGVHRDSVGFFGYDCVGVAIDGRVNAESKDVLVVLSQHARVNHISIVGTFARVDVDARDDSRGAGFDIDTTALVEFVRKDVFVVCEGDDELHDQDAGTGNHCTVSPPVGVFPTNAFILLMQTNNIRVDFAFSFIIHNHSVKVFDDA